MALIPRSETNLSERTGSALNKRTTSQVTELIIHYGDDPTPTTAREEETILKAYDDHHIRQGWGGIGYNLAVGPVTGRVFEARGLDRVGAHTKAHNTTGIGVCLIGGEAALTEKGKAGLREAYQIATKWVGRDLPVSGHREHADTSCPGNATFAWLKAGGLTTTPPKEGNNTVATKPKEEPKSEPTGVTADGNVYVFEQGKKIAPRVRDAFRSMAAAFKKETGYTLLLTGALRTREEQADLYARWKAGTFSAPDVARPGTSRHETGRALDIRDDGNSPGVTVAGNARSNWVKANCGRFGFQPTGYGYREPWHVEYHAGTPWGIVKGLSIPAKIKEDGNRGPETILRWQGVMGTHADGVISTPSSLIEADQRFLNSVVSSKDIKNLTGALALKVDGSEGVMTVRVRQFWLFNRYVGSFKKVTGRAVKASDFDGNSGPTTTKMHQIALNAAKINAGRY